MASHSVDIAARSIQHEIAQTIARQVVEIVREELGLRDGDEPWIDAKEVARRFGLSRAWVYAHARQLGAVRVGDGPKPRLRFLPSRVGAGLQAGPAVADRHAVEDVAGVAVPIHVPRTRPAKRNR